MPERKFGLIGKSLKHSFSKNYFSEKFRKEKIDDAAYDLYELASIKEVEKLFKMEGMKGFNVTIPYKLDIIPFLDEIEESAQKVGAVNVVKINRDGKRTGFNSDYYGFKQSLENWADLSRIKGAMILGTGGASKAVIEALKDLTIPIKIVSRSESKGDLTYDELNSDQEILESNQLIINCTPLGTYPNINSRPELNYEWLTSDHYMYDLVYNPEVTSFMKEGEKMGAKVKNGLEMLILQAEKSWEIWNS